MNRKNLSKANQLEKEIRSLTELSNTLAQITKRVGVEVPKRANPNAIGPTEEQISFTNHREALMFFLQSFDWTENEFVDMFCQKMCEAGQHYIEATVDHLEAEFNDL